MLFFLKERNKQKFYETNLIDVRRNLTYLMRHGYNELYTMELK